MARVRIFFNRELVAGGSFRKAGRIEGTGAKFVDLDWHRRKPYICPVDGQQTFSYWSSADGRKLCRVHEVEEVFTPTMTFTYRPTPGRRKARRRGIGR
jgi:hypothetical protein